jgi:hypothetical protein
MDVSRYSVHARVPAIFEGVDEILAPRDRWFARIRMAHASSGHSRCAAGVFDGGLDGM